MNTIEELAQALNTHKNMCIWDFSYICESLGLSTKVNNIDEMCIEESTSKTIISNKGKFVVVKR